MASSYAPLHLRSNYSLLTGAATIGEILGLARQLGLRAVALTDTNNLYAAIPFYRQAKELGIKPILGAHLTHASGGAVLLVRDLVGYANLCRILTRRNLSERFDLAKAIGRFREGLFILTTDAALAEQLAETVERESLWIELVAAGRSWMDRKRLMDVAKRLGVGVVATGDVAFCRAEDFELHRVLSAVGENRLVSDLDEYTGGEAKTVSHPQCYLMSHAEMQERFSDCPQALANTLKIAEACDLDLPLGKPIFPKCELPTGETPYSVLYKKCHEGLTKRYDPIERKAAERLTYELSVIHELGFADYFLVVADILGEARRRRIPIVGRGSGASSIVAYVLGITSVDPIRYRLPFERFLNTGRLDCPDLDIDLCWRRRDEIINYVYERFGADRVAMISTHNCFRKRSAFREVAKAFGISNDLVNRISRRLAYHSRAPLEEDLAASFPDLPCDDATLRKIIHFAGRVTGFPNHLSIHCGGIVIADKPIDSYVPLERAAKGIAITQYEMNAIEDIGLVKIDLLGNRGLSAISGTIQILDEHEDVRIDPEAIPEGDAKAFELIRSGRTIGCCQLESPAMRHLLLMLRPESVLRVMQALALIRPAPASIGMKETFVRRARGLEETTFPHPSLEKVLGDTYGIMLYEDDAMLLAGAMAGVSLEEGDRLRKAVKKAKSTEDLKKVSHYFLRRSVQNGVPLDVAKDTWMQIAKFNEYSFCRAHAAGYGLVAYRSAYLKAHHPAAYMVSALNNLQGLYPTRVHLWEAKRMGVEVLGPCVNHSGVEFTCEEGKVRVGLLSVKGLTQRTIERTLGERERRPFTSIRDYLERVRAGLSELESLILVGAFDFTGLNRPQLVWLARMTASGVKTRHGAPGNSLGLAEGTPEVPPLPGFSPAQKVEYEMDIIEMPISAHPVELVRGKGGRRSEEMTSGTTESTEDAENDGERDNSTGSRLTARSNGGMGVRVQRGAMSIEARRATASIETGDETTDRQECLSSYEKKHRRKGFVRCEDLPRLLGRRVQMIGILDTTRGALTKNGELMQFITMEDETGVFEVTLFPRLYARVRRLLTDCGPYVVTGRVEDQYGSISITAERLERLREGAGVR